MNTLPQCLLTTTTGGSNIHHHNVDKFDYKQSSPSFVSVRVTVDRFALIIERPNVNLELDLTAPVNPLTPDLRFFAVCHHIDLSEAVVRILPDDQSLNGTEAHNTSLSAALREQLCPKQPIIVEATTTEEEVVVTSEPDVPVKDAESDASDVGENKSRRRRQWVLFARGRREKEIILRVLEDAARYHEERGRGSVEAKEKGQDEGEDNAKGLANFSSKTFFYYLS